MHPIIPLLQLVHTLKQIEGRKKLQKMVHILKELGAPFPESFEYSYYGMYSLQLRSELSKLEAEKLITEEPQIAQGGNETFVVEATSELDRLIGEFGLREPPAWAARAVELNKMSPQKLEGISTVLFLQKTEKSTGSLRERLITLKPRLADLADDCIASAERLSVEG